jgi:hypothetical protein
MTNRAITGILAGVTLALAACAPPPATVEVHVNIRSHLFEPDVLHVPANTRVRLVIHNLDPTPEEFESMALNREKLVLGKSTTALLIGPLAVGDYPFSGVFSPHTAVGRIIAEDPPHAND